MGTIKTRAILNKHSNRRMGERYGRTITRKERELLVAQINEQKGEFVQKHTNRVTEWHVWLNDVKYRVLYCKQRKTIITFLPALAP
jgi:hypothetical protein